MFCLLLCHIQYPTNARYVIVNPNGTLKASSTFLLDAKTGKTWQLVVDRQELTVGNKCNMIGIKKMGLLEA